MFVAVCGLFSVGDDVHSIFLHYVRCLSHFTDAITNTCTSCLTLYENSKYDHSVVVVVVVVEHCKNSRSAKLGCMCADHVTAYRPVHYHLPSTRRRKVAHVICAVFPLICLFLLERSYLLRWVTSLQLSITEHAGIIPHPLWRLDFTGHWVDTTGFLYVPILPATVWGLQWTIIEIVSSKSARSSRHMISLANFREGERMQTKV